MHVSTVVRINIDTVAGQWGAEVESIRLWQVRIEVREELIRISNGTKTEELIRVSHDTMTEELCFKFELWIQRIYTFLTYIIIRWTFLIILIYIYLNNILKTDRKPHSKFSSYSLHNQYKRSNKAQRRACTIRSRQKW